MFIKNGEEIILEKILFAQKWENLAFEFELSEINISMQTARKLLWGTN